MSLAQGSSVITGTVTDAATGKPVPDVVVTASSPALQGEAVVVTDSAGLYRLAQLPAGVYSLRLEKESFKPFSRTEINVRTDRTIRVNIQVQPEAVTGDTIVVVGRPPTVDVGSTTTGINVGKEFINNIAFIQPNGSGVRTFESLAAVAPQVSADEYGYGFSGAQSPENLYLVDGVSTSNPAFGTNGAQLPVEFVEEANVITGGYRAEYGRSTGGVLNVVTKSGSNEFHGMVWGNWTPGALTGVSKEIKSDASVFGFQNRLINTVDFGAHVGGPIIKDKLWFFVGFAPSFVRNQTTRTVRRFEFNEAQDDFLYDEEGFIQGTPIPGAEKSVFNDVRAFSYMAKLTYLINSDHNIALSVSGSPVSANQASGFTNRRLANNWNGGFNSEALSNTASLRYQGGFFDKHLLADVSVGWYHENGETTPNDGSKLGSTDPSTAAGAPTVRFQRLQPYSITQFEDLPADSGCDGNATATTPQVTVRGQSRYLMHCPVTGGGQTYTIGGAGYLTNAALDRMQGRGSLTYMMQAAGHHTWKVGLDVEHLTYALNKGYTGGVFLQQNGSGSQINDFRNYGYFTGPDTAVPTLVVRSTPTSFGFAAYLQDTWSILDLVTLDAGVRYETQQLFASGGGLGMTLNNMLSPRIGLIYDFTQQGRSKLHASYSRYYEAMPINIADRSLTGENTTRFNQAASTNSGMRPGCDPLADFNQVFTACRDPLNRVATSNAYGVNRYGFNIGSGRTPVDPNLQAQNSDEIIAGGEYEIINDGRLGVTYTKRWMNEVVEDMSLDEGNTYFIGNPGKGLASAFPKATRDYDAVTVSFTKAFSDGWMAQANYTWSYLRGNYNGLFRPETGQLDPNINSDFDLISLLANRTGPLSADRTHYIKAYAAKQFVIAGGLALTVGLTYEGRSGTALNYYGAHPVYGQDESFVLPRGSAGRLPWRHAINAKAGVEYRFNKDNTVQFTADVFNVFNFQAVTSVDETLSTETLLPFIAPAGQNPAEAACLSGSANPACANGQLKIQTIDGTTGLPVDATSDLLNANFKRPTGYQAPISVRFGLRFTF